MLRFHPFTPRTTARSTNRYRWRLGMLVVALGLVVALMQLLHQPEAVSRLDQVFLGPEQTESEFALESNGSIPGKDDTADFAESEQPKPQAQSVAEEKETSLSQVKDKTFFRPEEQAAWFSLFAKLQQMDDGLFSNENIPQPTYAQLLQQPDVYRGRLVTIRGTVLRSELQQSPANQPGIASYHRLWIQPQGGGQWPFVVYCLDLPEDFPSGDNLRETVSVTGFFFKNWSYSYGDGLGLAPVILARKLDWQQPISRPVTRALTSQHWITGLVIAGVFAAFATWQILRRTSRPSSSQTIDAKIQQQLQQLAKGEGGA